VIIDISPPIGPDLAVWPGDVSFSQSWALRMDAGANLDLSSITTTVHLGAHADGPSHYAEGAPGIGERSLERYYGPCEVVRVDVSRGSRVRPADLPAHLHDGVRAPRVLLYTGTYPDPTVFNEDFAALSPELVAWLHDRGVTLVGIDTPSVDPCTDKVLRSHKAIAARDMAILEGLVLHHVEPGLYTLIALPLRIPGADASPVRAALIPAGPA